MIWAVVNARPALSIPFPDGKVHGANMGPIWGPQDTDGPHVGLMNFAIKDYKTWLINQTLPYQRYWQCMPTFQPLGDNP